MSVGVIVTYMVRINMSVAIVAMTRTPNSTPALTSGAASTAHANAFCTLQNQVNRSRTTEQEEEDGVSPSTVNFTDTHNTTDQYSDVMNLTSTQRGMVLGAFFYGYFCTQIPGGWLAETYGTKWIFGASVLTNGILSFFIPSAARVHFGLLMFLRVLIGVSQGVVFPTLNIIVIKWIPPLEQPRFMAFTFMSSCLGTVITMPLCGVIIANIGWPAVFYVGGGVSLLWVLLWMSLMHETPEEHPTISAQERQYILDNIKREATRNKPGRTPWKSFLTSVPLWAAHTSQMGSMFGFNLLLTQLPTYMDNILGFSIETNGLLSSLPFLVMFVGANFWGTLGDWLIANHYISRHVSRKLFSSISMVLPGLMLVTVGYVGCNTTLAVTLFTVGMAFSGAVCSGHRVNHIDLAPNFSGTTLGMSNTLAFAVSMCVPVIVGAMTPDQVRQVVVVRVIMIPDQVRQQVVDHVIHDLRQVSLAHLRSVN
ncbi:sialin-like isoform X2 [Panulirus ornatus]